MTDSDETLHILPNNTDARKTMTVSDEKKKCHESNYSDSLPNVRESRSSWRCFVLIIIISVVLAVADAAVRMHIFDLCVPAFTGTSVSHETVDFFFSCTYHCQFLLSCWWAKFMSNRVRGCVERRSCLCNWNKNTFGSFIWSFISPMRFFTLSPHLVSRAFAKIRAKIGTLGIKLRSRMKIWGIVSPNRHCRV